MQNDFTGCSTSKNFWKHWKKGLTLVSEKTKTEMKKILRACTAREK